MITERLRSVVLILWLFPSLIDSITIIDGPKSVTNASVDGSVDFNCITEGAASPPIWNINGRDYRVTELPLNHKYYSEGYLEITPISLSMNNSMYFCYYLSYIDGVFVIIKSENATLVISPQGIKSYNLTSVNQFFDTAQTVVPSSSSMNTGSILPKPPRPVTANSSTIITIILLLVSLLACVAIFILSCCICYNKRWSAGRKLIKLKAQVETNSQICTKETEGCCM